MFKVYATTDQRMPPSQIAEHARRAEALGYDGLNIPEALHDGLLMSSMALTATTRLKVATSVLVAFPRSPMTVAMAAWDLQAVSGGRFELGLGSQVRGNIVGRYSTSWAAPVPRMREYVHSLRTIFDAFQNDTPLDVQGEHYRFKRLQPFFNPGPIEHPDIPILLGGVGPKMTALAGEVADGLVTHPSSTPPRYVREVTIPLLEKGATRAGRSSSDVPLMLGPLIATGIDAVQTRAARDKWRETLTFLYATPSYWGSLELFGWKERGEKLHALSREGKWAEMAGLIDDEMLDAIVPSAPYPEICTVLREWYGDLSTAITFPMPDDPAQDAEAAKVIAELKG